MPRPPAPNSRAIEDALRVLGVAEAEVERMMRILRTTLGGRRIYVRHLPAAEREVEVVRRHDPMRG